MSSPVLYRKWRPQRLTEVVGQGYVTRTLLNALATGRVAHAYLFTGPRGTGKTSTARILAKAVNCLENGRGEPCGACTMCEAIADGRALDLIEIDAASNRGIDDIRALREKINFAPNEARHKVYVVDEVHMLTTEAFNALLKTLEEPPPYAIFVLATTEVHRVPVTILSRCQRFDFHRIPQADLVGYLATICEAEHIAADPAALDLIARSANGGARDAVNLLEQVEVAGDGEVRLEAVQQLLGLTGDPRSVELVKRIAEDRLGEALALVQRVAEDGLPLAQFGKEVAGHLRSLLLLKARTGGVDLAPELATELGHLAQRMPLDRVVQALRLFSQMDFRGDASSSLPLELALVDTLLAEVGEGAGHGASPEPAHLRPAPVPRPSGIGDRGRVPAPVREPEAPTPRAVPTGPLTVEELRVLIKEVKIPQLKFIESLLRNGCSIEDVDGGFITLGFRPGLASHKERVERPESLRLVEEAVKELTGTPYRIRCTLVEQPPGAPSSGGGHLVQAAIKAGAKRVPPQEMP